MESQGYSYEIKNEQGDLLAALEAGYHCLSEQTLARAEKDMRDGQEAEKKWAAYQNRMMLQKNLAVTSG